MGLLEGMQYYKGQRNLVLYWDIETLAYNKIEGRKKPTKYKNVVYSVAVGWDNNGTIDVEVFPSFKVFFDTFFAYAKRKDTITKSRTTVSMIAHNCNKYDNHFLLHDLMNIYPDIKRENLFMTNAEVNENTVNLKTAKMDSKEDDIILEKRVKSSINLDLTFFLKGFKFTIIDNFMKTTSSIAMLGTKLFKAGYLTVDQLKTDFDYEKFDIDEDMTESQSYIYAQACYEALDEDQMTYIHNDVIILGQCHIHFSEIFPGFDYKAMTFSVNIMKSYLNNEFTRFQLLNEMNKEKISYTNYHFHDKNLYDYIKSFYRGGLNFYNTKYLSKVIEEPCFSIDINSSYPYVMHHEKIPTWLSDYGEFETETKVNTNLSNRDKFTLYAVDKYTFNTNVLFLINSRVLKQMIVKYYSNADDQFIYINTNTLRMIQTLTGVSCESLHCLSYLTFDCEYFSARDIIFDNYYIKTQGKQKNIVKMTSPYDYEITDVPNEKPYTQEEIALSKVVLNGLYGIPALRSHFNLFRLSEDGQLENFINGYKNTERNLLFSTFVTSQSLYNLLEPLKYLTQQEIDDNFVYCDTDSLYLKSVIKDKIDGSIFDPIKLGKWDVENDVIEKMYVLNHKKYAYLKPSGKIHVASAGIPLKAFNTDMSFDEFLETQFYEGATVSNNKSIYNEQGTISIYPSKTHIDKGEQYPEYYSVQLTEARKEIIKQAKAHYDFSKSDDYIYVESNVGSFSITDLFPVTHSIEKKSNVRLLKLLHEELK